MVKKYTMDDLRDFCERADTEEKEKTAREFITSRPYLTAKQKEELLEYLDICRWCDYDEKNPFLPDYLDRDERDYSPSNPWDAPGMRVSDFISGVSYF